MINTAEISAVGSFLLLIVLLQAPQFDSFNAAMIWALSIAGGHVRWMRCFEKRGVLVQLTFDSWAMARACLSALSMNPSENSRYRYR